MRKIPAIRNALDGIEGARFAIALRKPPLRATGTVVCQDCGVSDLAISQRTKGSDQSPSDVRELEIYFKHLDAAIQADGIDALAWYVSFHNTSDEWGIYMPTTSIHYLSACLKSLGLDESEELRAEIALRVMLLHEIFHFYADYAQAQFELILREPCRNILRAQLGTGRYLEIEEAAANAFMLKSLHKIYDQKVLDCIEAFVKIQPAGYRDGIEFAEDDEIFGQGLREVVKSYVGLPLLYKSLTLDPHVLDWEAFYPDLNNDLIYDCPVHFIQDSDTFKLPEFEPKFFTSIKDIRETAYFERRLTRLAKQHQKAWADKKAQLSQPPINRKQFERLSGDKNGVYSVRIGKGHRAHLKPSNGYVYWDALDIGTHTEMGHD